MWRDHVAWRKREGIYELVQTADGPAPQLCAEYQLATLPALKAAYPFVHHKVRCHRCTT